MTQDVRDYVIEKSKALMEAPTCSQAAKDAAQARLAAAELYNFYASNTSPFCK